MAEPNIFMSSQKSAVKVVLHPLPILEISDYIIRSAMQRRQGPIVGMLLGQRSGREVTQFTVEHSFTCNTLIHDHHGGHVIDNDWFNKRREQMRAVHKDPQLDIVGWYTLMGKNGPDDDHIPIQEQLLLEFGTDAPILLAFHVEDVLRPPPGNPLPFSIYEGRDETPEGATGPFSLADEEVMTASYSNSVVRFLPVPYTTETGDAEMIAMQFIREGGANADAQASTADSSKSRNPTYRDLLRGNVAAKPEGKTKGKGKDKGKETASDPASNDNVLSKEELELISSLQSKANALKMMKARLALVISYLQNLPREPLIENAPPAAGGHDVLPSHKLLRKIQTIVANLNLVSPAEGDDLQKEMLQLSNDVTAVSMLKDLLASVTEMREIGKKFAVVEATKVMRSRRANFSDITSGQPLSVGDAGDINLS